MNIVSMNDPLLFAEDKHYIRFDMMVSENQRIYDDTFLLGVKLCFLWI